MIAPIRLPLLAVCLLVPVTQGAETKSQPLSPPSGTGGAPLFHRLPAAECGVTHVQPEDADHPLRRLYHSSMACGGVAIGDVDGDGRPDLFFSSGPAANRLYRNLGGMKFADITESAGVSGGSAWSAGSVMVDIDHDGDLDLYVSNYDTPNHLFLNDGKAVFTESAAAWGLDVVDAGLVSAFADYDRDGDLDVYLMHNRYYWPEGRPKTITSEIRAGKRVIAEVFERYFRLVPGDPHDVANWKFEEIARPDRLLRNEGGRFVDVSTAAGLEPSGDYGNSVTWYDYNHDGWLDIWVGNDFETADKLYRNNGDGTFSNVIRGATPLTCWYSMGAGMNDLNNDGFMDFVIVDMAATTHYKGKVTMGEMNAFLNFMDTSEPREAMRNMVYFGTGTESLIEAGYLTGLAKSDWSWAVKLNDYDNDGRVDCFITNGMVRNFSDSDRPVTPEQLVGTPIYELFRSAPQRREENMAFRNEGDYTFKNVSKAWGLDHLGMSYGAAAGDLDGDGDLDLVVNNLGEEVFVYRNDAPSGQRAVFSLRDPRGNRFGFGATVAVRTAAGTFHRQLLPHQGFTSSDEPILHFGLGEQSRMEEVVVTWNDGHRQVLRDLEAGRHYTVVRGEAVPATPAPAPATWFAATQSLSSFKHEDLYYDDLKKQLLLPNKMSNLGPGLAWGDVDGNGLDDVYLGGAAEQMGELRLQVTPGEFKRVAVPDFYADKDCEDLGALFFDADGDGDLDLFVAGGSNEMDNDDPSLRNRLYRNDGKGGLTLAPDGAIPDDRDYSSAVVAADFDRDGDLDLFVGGRMVPGRYPVSPRSRLLRNEGGVFTDDTDAIAPGLSAVGMVTGALWSDSDGDGWVDLLVTTEYGPVRLFHNQNGKLADRTEAAGLASLHGWWNGIAGRDVDNDGDLDYLVTNFGLNTKYKVDDKRPVRLYYGDFFDTGAFEIVEAGWQGEQQIPVRGRSCSGTAMPTIARKFPSYHLYASAGLEEIYTRPKLSAARQWHCNTLYSGLLLNQGGVFQFRPLPRIAQSGVAFSPTLTELDGDGLCDAFVTQNFFHPQRETPRMAGGLGLVLRGDGQGGLAYLWTRETGVRMLEDGRGGGVVDLNGDGWADLVAMFNHHRPQTYLRQPPTEHRSFELRLAGKARGNRTGIGARVAVELSSGLTQTAEMHAGGGYLTGNPAALFFGLPGGQAVKEIRVTWPDGVVSRHAAAEIPNRLVLHQPGA
jgi:hypothetical protein